jgi:hypothetical protein
MTKLYDSQYSTKVAFNVPIMRDMLAKKDISLVKHWLDNGEPNKNLAQQALYELLLMKWEEALELLWSKEWITKKAFISKAWLYVTAPYGQGYNQPIRETEIEKWLINKTYNEKILSKNEINNLHLSLLEGMTSSRNNYYWDMFFTTDLIIKGAKSKDIFWSLNYFSHHDFFNSNSKKDESLENLSKERLQRFISHKNGFEVDPQILLKILIDIKDLDLFDNIMEAKFKMDTKKLFILATGLGIFFNSICDRIYKWNETVIQEKLNFVVKQLVRAGLTKEITFTKCDLEDEYSKFFDLGYISLYSLGIDTYSRADASVARHLPYVYSGYYNSDKIVDTTFSSGEALFHKPTKDKFGLYKYEEPSQVEKQNLNLKMSTYFK